MRPDDIFPFLIGFGLVVLLPIVALLLHHQRKMAEFLHGQRQQNSQASDERLRQLSAEVADLRMLFHDLVIKQDGPAAIESRLREQMPPTPPQHITQR